MSKILFNSLINKKANKDTKIGQMNILGARYLSGI